MRTIYKYGLSAYQGHHIMEVPDDYEFLSIVVQRGDPVMYAMVDPDKPKVKVRILALHTSTNRNIDDLSASQFLGTAVLMDGDYVLHYFEDNE